MSEPHSEEETPQGEGKPETSEAAPNPDETNSDFTGATELTKGIGLRPFNREGAAMEIAKRLVQIFGYALGLVIVLGFISIGVVLFVCRCDVTKAGEVFGKTVVPLLTAVGTFAATVFAPLLAFILGYYFGEKKQL